MKVTLLLLGSDEATVLAEPDVSRVPAVGEGIDLSPHGTPLHERKLFDVMHVMHTPVGPSAATLTVAAVTIVGAHR